MEKKTCEICGYTSKHEDLVIYRIVPEEIATQAGILDKRKVVLCTNCCNELQAWYLKRVFGMSYDAGTVQFVPKSSADMVKEYEAAYRAFATYKSGIESRDYS